MNENFIKTFKHVISLNPDRLRTRGDSKLLHYDCDGILCTKCDLGIPDDGSCYISNEFKNNTDYTMESHFEDAVIRKIFPSKTYPEYYI